MDGLLRVDKPSGWTSHDAVSYVRSRLGREVRVGHTGTLDPVATGLLLLLIGRATRLQAEFQRLPKIYSGRIRLGLATETGDLDSKERAERPVPDLTLEGLQACLKSWEGLISLPAPAYSAVKYKGQPLYAYARKGIEVPRGERKTTVYAWRAEAYRSPEFDFSLECSSGTYVRALALALGEKLDCGATVTALRREAVGAYNLAGALLIDKSQALTREAIASRLEAPRI